MTNFTVDVSQIVLFIGVMAFIVSIITEALKKWTWLQEVRRMSDMMKMFVEQELQNQIKENYPHMQYPPGLYAKVVSVRQNGELYEATLKILDKNKQPDIRFPEVPKVKTDIPVLKNEIVAIVLMYGECKPYIIGRCF